MDCLEGMKRIKDNFVDVIITSPPYNKAGYEGIIRKPTPRDTWSRRNIDYEVYNDFMPEDKYEEWQIQVLNECFRILKPNGSMFYNHKVRMSKHKSIHPIQWILQSKFIFRQQITWDRNMTPAVAPIRFLPTNELIFWLTKQAKQPNFVRSKECPFKTETWSFRAAKDNDHPAPFPLELPLNILINIPGENIVLDPFMGSGTTAKAALKTGNKFIGFELNEKYIIPKWLKKN